MELTTALSAAILLVRIYPAGPYAGKDVEAAQKDAAATLQAAGVTVGWIDCSSAGSHHPDAACARPLGPSEVVLRIVSSSPVEVASRRTALGESLIDRTSRELPRLATVYADRVATLADRARANRRQLLAWAMAHEIGHLLLNTTRHSTRGLMRAVWSQSELARSDPRDWAFSRTDVRALRSALASRAALKVADQIQIPKPTSQNPNPKG
jgi:hypothetical protein